METRFSLRANNMTPTLHVAPMGSDFVVYTLEGMVPCVSKRRVYAGFRLFPACNKVIKPLSNIFGPVYVT